ncbi:MAG: hypothetical protein ACWGSQ_19980 [Longimicrobiales bacterium]
MMKGLLTAGAMALISFASVGAQQAHPNPTTLTVDNTRDVPVMVYLERGPFDIRLGQVPAHGQETLMLPRTMEDGEQIQVFVHPEGGVDLASDELTVKLGGTMVVTVPTNDVGFVPPPPPEKIPNPGEGTTTVTVQNNRSVPVTVFVERGEFDTRIGTVPANREETLLIPDWLARERPSAEIFVHPENGVDLESWVLDLKPGAHLFVKVPVYGT